MQKGPETVTIKLSKGIWTYDPEKLLGPPGGFGEVFWGKNSRGEDVAVKRLKLEVTIYAHRELRIADELAAREFQHVLPVYDSGKDAESEYYYIVMPKAELSLQQRINIDGKLNETESSSILREIALGLLEVKEIVHRDLKPANILYYNSAWRIADFGIARFVEESTSLNTLKECLTPPYAAPEQWQLQRATNATDVYALGCIGYTLLTGKPPFSGPMSDDYRNQHLHANPPSISKCDPRLSSLLSLMLRKVPETRPSLQRVVDVLKQIANQVPSDDSGFSSLSEAGAAVAHRQAEEEARKSLERSEEQRRMDLANHAKTLFKEIREDLFKYICDAAPAAVREGDLRVRLGKAVIVMRLIEDLGVISAHAFSQSKWDVILGAEIVVRQDSPRYIWSSSIWYAKIQPDDDYRWREVSYFKSPFLLEHPLYEPHSLQEIKLADEAAKVGHYEFQIAWGPKPIDDENLPEFKSRWADILAKGAQGNLSHPRHLPLE
jgi:hypothetical protein